MFLKLSQHISLTFYTLRLPRTYAIWMMIGYWIAALRVCRGGADTSFILQREPCNPDLELCQSLQKHCLIYVESTYLVGDNANLFGFSCKILNVSFSSTEMGLKMAILNLNCQIVTRYQEEILPLVFFSAV